MDKLKKQADLLNKTLLASLASIKESVHGWKWKKVGEIEVLFPQDERSHRPTIFFVVSDKKKVPHYIIEDEPDIIIENGGD